MRAKRKYRKFLGFLVHKLHDVSEPESHLFAYKANGAAAYCNLLIMSVFVVWKRVGPRTMGGIVANMVNRCVLRRSFDDETPDGISNAYFTQKGF